MGKSHLRFALALGAIVSLAAVAAPVSAAPEHPTGLERAAQVHERNEDRREDRDRDDHPRVVIEHPAPKAAPVTVTVNPAPAPVTITNTITNTVTVNVTSTAGYSGSGNTGTGEANADPPSSASQSTSSASSSSGGSGGSGTVSDDSGRLAVCHYEPATAPKLDGGALVPGTPAGFQIRFLFRYQLDQYVNATSPDYFSVTGDCGTGSNPASV